MPLSIELIHTKCVQSHPRDTSSMGSARLMFRRHRAIGFFHNVTATSLLRSDRRNRPMILRLDSLSYASGIARLSSGRDVAYWRPFRPAMNIALKPQVLQAIRQPALCKHWLANLMSFHGKQGQRKRL